MKEGDEVTRIIAGVVPMKMVVTKLTPTEIHCGGWKFDRETGAEIDEYLGWGPDKGITGSYLQLKPLPKTNHTGIGECEACKEIDNANNQIRKDGSN